MLKSELLEENKRLKKELDDVCEHHKRLTILLNTKIDRIYELEERLKDAEK